MAEMEVEESARVTSKYEDLVRQQLSHSSSKEEMSHAGGETDLPRADTSDSKRHTPIGDIAAGDGAGEVGDDFSLGARIMDDILRQHHRNGDPMQDSSCLGAGEDAGSKGGRHTPLSRASTEAEVERLPGPRPYTPERLQQEPRFRRPSAESDKASQKSRDSQGKGASETESIEDIIRRYSSASSRQTPTGPEAVEDVLGGEGRPSSTGRRTPQHDRLSWQDRQTPTRDILRDSRHQSPDSLPRKSEVKDLVTPPLPGSKTEEVPSRPDSVGSADLGASGSLRGQGRPQSLTSEQELSQYFDHRPHSRSSSSSAPRPSPAPPRAESDTLHYPTPPGSRPLSSTSLPARPGATQRGRATPDFQVRLPSRQSETKAAADRLTPASLQSSRTVTPIRETDRASSSSDMESSITNLRKLLFAREAEVEELKKQIQEQKSINKSLTDQLDRLLRDPANQEHMDLSQQLQQLQSEKEILAAEVVKLRDVLASSGRVDPQALSRIGLDVQSPESLQKQIGELQRQMEGYQAASESAASRLARAEARVRELQEENRELRRSSSSDGGLPHRSVAIDKETLHYRDQDLEIRREVRQLREDINVLKGLNQAEERGSGFRRDRQLDSGYLQDFPRSAAEPLDNRSPSPGLLDPRSEVRERRSNYRTDSTSATEYTSSQHASRATLTRDNLEKHRHSRYADDFSSSLDQLEMKQSSKDRSFDLAGRDTYHRHSSADDKYESKNARLNAYDPSLVGMREPQTRIEDGYLRNGRPSYSAHTRETSYHRSKVSGPEELRGSHLDRSLPDGQAEVKSSSFQQSAYSSSSSKERSRREVSKEFREERGDLWRQSSDYGFLERNLKPDFRTAAAPATEDAGDVSDTATEILLSIRPEASQLRPSSSFSDDSDDLLSDTENPGASSLHRRSRSLDAKRSGAVPGWGVSSTGSPVFTSSAAASHLRQSTSTERLASSPTPPPASSTGFRSVTPKPLATQHNKAWSTSSSSPLTCSLTQGMRPFAPRSPADMRLGDVVKFSRQGGRLSQGTVKFVGHLPGRSDAYLGVELDKEEGRHDGVFEDIRYFRCKPNKGVFVAFNKIVMAWAPC